MEPLQPGVQWTPVLKPAGGPSGGRSARLGSARGGNQAREGRDGCGKQVIPTARANHTHVEAVLPATGLLKCWRARTSSACAGGAGPRGAPPSGHAPGGATALRPRPPAEPPPPAPGERPLPQVVYPTRLSWAALEHPLGPAPRRSGSRANCAGGRSSESRKRNEKHHLRQDSLPTLLPGFLSLFSFLND